MRYYAIGEEAEADVDRAMTFDPIDFDDDDHDEDINEGLVRSEGVL